MRTGLHPALEGTDDEADSDQTSERGHERGTHRDNLGERKRVDVIDG